MVEYSSGTGTLAAGAVPTTAAHLTGIPVAQLIEKLDANVRQTFEVMSVMKSFFTPIQLRGTNAYAWKQYGGANFTQVVPGVSPAITGKQTAKRVLTVDYQIVALDALAEIEQIKDDVGLQSKISKEHGTKFAKIYDTLHFIQAIKGASLAAVTATNGAIGAGTVKAFAAIGDETDPDKILDLMDTIVEEWELADKPIDPSYRWFVTPDIYSVLQKHTRLINADYTEVSNGDFAMRKLKNVAGIPIMSTARIPQAASTAYSDLLGTTFDVTAEEAKTKIVLMNSESLIVLENQPVFTDSYRFEHLLTDYIRTRAALTVGVDRQDTIAIVKKLTA